MRKIVLTLFLAAVIEIHVGTVDNGKAPVKYIDFARAASGECTLSMTGKTQTLTSHDCEKLMKTLAPDLSEPAIPSEYLNPKVKYYQVEVHADGKVWNRATQRMQNSLCSVEGDCTVPAKPPAWRIVKALESAALKK